MDIALKNFNQSEKSVQPLCPAFNTCGGCLFQNISYADELQFKEQHLKELLKKSIDFPDEGFHSIVRSPNHYNYRNRLDMKLKRTQDNDILVGFTPIDGKGIIPVDACYIADQAISAFIPEMKKQAIKRLPAKYHNANLTVRIGDDGKIHWGGIGRRSCQLEEKDYFWTSIKNKRIHYSLDTFFQANLSILPKLFDVIEQFPIWDSKPVLYDLYGGVGFFSIGLYDHIRNAILIEESQSSLQLARYNIKINELSNVEVRNGKVEDELSQLLHFKHQPGSVAIVDPPRAGLSDKVRRMLSTAKTIDYIVYLSCNPESLVQDLYEMSNGGWKVDKIIPFDFFPKTKHLETLVLLQA